MANKPKKYLSRREEQIMDIVYRSGKATAAEVYEEMDDAPSYSSTRVMMHLLEDKGLLRHEKQGPRYVYFPSVSAEKARRKELSHVVNTFFGGSMKEAMADLIDLSERDISEEEWDAINALIDEARKQGR